LVAPEQTDATPVMDAGGAGAVLITMFAVVEFEQGPVLKEYVTV
jgi:hypothetical protein